MEGCSIASFLPSPISQFLPIPKNHQIIQHHATKNICSLWRQIPHDRKKVTFPHSVRIIPLWDTFIFMATFSYMCQSKFVLFWWRLGGGYNLLIGNLKVNFAKIYLFKLNTSIYINMYIYINTYLYLWIYQTFSSMF